MNYEDNCVYIGDKETNVYVFAVQTQAQINSEVIIKAYGKNISKAVDVAQISINRFLVGWIQKDVSTGTEKKTVRKDDMELIEKFSYINITLVKK